MVCPCITNQTLVVECLYIRMHHFLSSTRNKNTLLMGCFLLTFGRQTTDPVQWSSNWYTLIEGATWHGVMFDTLKQRQSDRHFTDDNLKCISWNEICWILNQISLNSVTSCPIDNKTALVRIMACCRTGNKPSSVMVWYRVLYYNRWIMPN